MKQFINIGSYRHFKYVWNFGIYDEKNKNLIDKCKIGLDIIKYRGPDKSIFIKNNDFIGGTNRLAIEALKNGDQPVENDEL